MFQPHTCFSVEHTAGDGDLRGRDFDWLYRYGIIAFLAFHPLHQKTILVLSYKCVYFYHQNFQIHCIANHILLTCNVFTLMSWNPLVLSYICVLLSPKLSNSLHCKPYARLSVLGHYYSKVRNICAYILTNACTPMSASYSRSKRWQAISWRQNTNWEAIESLTSLTKCSRCHYCSHWNVLSLCLFTAGNKRRKIIQEGKINKIIE